MYDALLEDLEDEGTPATEDAVDLADKDDDDDDLGDDLLVAADDGEPDAELKPDELLLAASDDGESWSDDPVRMYLTQMGEIPLLTRRQEIALAKRSLNETAPEAVLQRGEVTQCLSEADLAGLREAMNLILVNDQLVDYAVQVVRRTRSDDAVLVGAGRGEGGLPHSGFAGFILEARDGLGGEAEEDGVVRPGEGGFVHGREGCSGGDDLRRSGSISHTYVRRRICVHARALHAQ